MPALLALSTEIPIQVLAASDTIPDALRLSAISHHLREIWHEHSTQITEAILRASIPTYEKTLALAITETQLQSSSDEKPSLREYLPTLLRNADLCASACLAYLASFENAPSPSTSYSFLRRIGLGYEYHQITQSKFQRNADDSCWYESLSAAGLGIAEQIRQGVLPEDYDHDFDLYRETESKWDYLNYCICSGAICDIDRGTNYLSITIQGFDI